MTMLTEEYEFVIGGDPDRDTIDLAVLDSSTGAVRAHLEVSADGAGYVRTLDWANTSAPGRRVWALEGTGSFAAGLAEALAEAGEDVSKSVLSSEPGARRTTDWMRSGPHAPRWPVSIRPLRGSGDYVRRSAR